MATSRGVIGTFTDPPGAARAIRALRAAGVGDVQVAMPAAFPEVVAAIARPRSTIDYVTLPGALLGLVAGIALTVGGSLDWPLWVGGKPPVSIPSFVVVVFELTVLFGSLVNLGVVATTTWFGGQVRHFPAHEKYNGDRIGVFVPGGDERASTVMRANGAEEVSHVG